jgi:hypothetical protein
MKKIIQFTFLLLFLQQLLIAAPGDTTRVPIHVLDSLTWYGTYSRTAQLPTANTSYRKIYLLYTIGRYQCPNGTQYCGQWDYSLDFVAKPLNPSVSTETFEIARAITPYAGTGSVFNTAWTHTYWFDVTDWAPILKDSLSLEAHYSGYSGGFTLKTELMYIEGTPAQDVVSIHKVQQGYYNYGGTPSIESYLIPDTTKILAPATHADMLVSITGHGSDNNGCAEFCPRYYDINLNGNKIATENFWKICGFCDIQAQTGTWIYDRGGWCPGERVLPVRHHLPNIALNTDFVVDMDLQSHTSNNGGAGYSVASYIFAYKDPNFATDAEIEDIMSPSTKNDYKKYNPSAVSPIIVLKNNGSNTLTSAVIKYGIKNQAMMTYNWSGSLASTKSEVVTMPSIPWATGLPDSSEFIVILDKANGATDQYAMNDTSRSLYVAPPSLPKDIILRFTTNNTSYSTGAINETSWKLFDQNGALVKERVNCANSTTFNDTLSLTSQAYQLVFTDAGWEDGMSWWVYGSYPTNPGNGAFSIRNSTGGLINNSITKINTKYYNGDFGSKFIYNFRVAWPTGTNDSEFEPKMNFYPNPANTHLYVNFEDISTDVDVQLLSLEGKVLASEKSIKGKEISFVTQNIPSGLYMIRCTSNSQTWLKKIVVSH